MLEGKTVVVTGGSSGMGFATAKAVVEAEGYVVIVARDGAKIDRARTELGENAQGFSVDVTKEDQVREFFEGLDPFDHLVSCAAGVAMGPFLESDTASVRDYFESKFWGQYYTAKHGAKKIKRGGSITFFAGAANRKASPGLTPSASINGAIEGLAKTLAVELAPLRVNVVSPGLIDTEAFDPLPPENKDGLFQSVSAVLPLGRIGSPEEVARTVLHLMESEYTTGAVAVIDGGYSAGSMAGVSR